MPFNLSEALANAPAKGVYRMSAADWNEASRLLEELGRTGVVTRKGVSKKEAAAYRARKVAGQGGTSADDLVDQWNSINRVVKSTTMKERPEGAGVYWHWHSEYPEYGFRLEVGSITTENFVGPWMQRLYTFGEASLSLDDVQGMVHPPLTIVKGERIESTPDELRELLHKRWRHIASAIGRACDAAMEEAEQGGKFFLEFERDWNYNRPEDGLRVTFQKTIARNADAVPGQLRRTGN